MADFVELNTGGFILLNTGRGCLLLNTDTGGVTIKNQHATPMVFSRPQQLITVDYSFILKSCLITKTGVKLCLKGATRAISKSSIKIKGALLKKFKESFAVTSSLLIKQRFNWLKVKSATLVMENVKIGIFANTARKNLKKTKMNEHKLKKKKEFLLRRLKEMLDDGR